MNLEKVNNDAFINSACFLNYKNEIYILSSNSQIYIAEQIKVYNLKGNIIQKINDSNDNIYFIDIYYDNELSNIYILISSKKYCKSFNYKQNKLYHKYSTIDNQTSFGLNIIKDKETKLLSSDSFGNINIWNFHSGLILKKICIKNKSLYEICQWDNEHILVGCEDNTIKIIDINNEIIINELKKIMITKVHLLIKK